MAEKSYDVFISYSTKDSEQAFALLKILEDHGLRCWIAPRNIPRGAKWADEIDKAIQNARVFVVIVSSHSVESKQVPKEVALAVTACESIFPFRIDDIGLQGSFRYYLSDYQFTDATTDPSKKMTELADAICYSLGKPIPAASEEQEPAEAIPAETAPKTAVPAEPAQKPAEKTESAKDGQTKKPMIIGAAAVAVAAIVILAVVLSGKGKQSTKTENAVQNPSAETAEQSMESDAAQESSAAQTAEESQEPEAAEESAETEAAETEESAETEAEETVQTAFEASSEAHPLFGQWKLKAFKDLGASLGLEPLEVMVVNADGTVCADLDSWVSASASGTALPVLTADGDSVNYAETDADIAADPDKYDLSTVYSFEDSYDGRYDADTLGFGVSVAPYVPSSSKLKGENPTEYTYESIYPEVYLYLHITGTVQESPVKKSEADTWVVYKKQYPILSESFFPSFAGDWEDSMGNTWSFGLDNGNLIFVMTDSAGTVYNGSTVNLTEPDKTQDNFFERVQFVFEEYTTDEYAVVGFDGRKLELLDESWESFTLTKK